MGKVLGISHFPKKGDDFRAVPFSKKRGRLWGRPFGDALGEAFGDSMRSVSPKASPKASPRGSLNASPFLSNGDPYKLPLF